MRVGGGGDGSGWVGGWVGGGGVEPNMNDYHKISEIHARWDHNWVAMISYPFDIKIGKVNWLLFLGCINSHPITMCHKTSIRCHDVADPTIILMCLVYKWSVCVSRLCCFSTWRNGRHVAGQYYRRTHTHTTTTTHTNLYSSVGLQWS